MSSSISSARVKTIQAEKLLYNIEDSLNEKKKRIQTDPGYIDPIWKKMIQAIETIVKENCIDEDLLERLKSKKIRLELEIEKAKIKKFEGELPSVDRSVQHEYPTQTSKIIQDTENVNSENEKVSAEKIQRLLQDQKVRKLESIKLFINSPLGYSFQGADGGTENEKCFITGT